MKFETKSFYYALCLKMFGVLGLKKKQIRFTNIFKVTQVYTFHYLIEALDKTICTFCSTLLSHIFINNLWKSIYLSTHKCLVVTLRTTSAIKTFRKTFVLFDVAMLRREKYKISTFSLKFVEVVQHILLHSRHQWFTR